MNGQTAEASPAVIGYQCPFAMRIHRYITGIVSPAGLLIQELQLPGGFVEGKGADPSRFGSIRLIDGIQVFSTGRQGQVRGIVGCYRTNGSRIPGGDIELEP